MIERCGCGIAAREALGPCRVWFRAQDLSIIIMSVARTQYKVSSRAQNRAGYLCSNVRRVVVAEQEAIENTHGEITESQRLLEPLEEIDCVTEQAQEFRESHIQNRVVGSLSVSVLPHLLYQSIDDRTKVLVAVVGLVVGREQLAEERKEARSADCTAHCVWQQSDQCA